MRPITVSLALVFVCVSLDAAAAPQPRKAAPKARKAAPQPHKGAPRSRVAPRVGVKAGKGPRGPRSQSLKVMRARAKSRLPKLAFVPCSASTPKEAESASQPKAGMEGLVTQQSYLWPNGATLNVHFIDGTPEARKAVQEVADIWTEHANLKFAFFLDPAKPPPTTHIRIQFDDSRCDSYIGTSSQYHADSGGVTMHLCHMDKDVGSDWFHTVVLHEFGHAIGNHHEHQSPKSNIPWDKEYVYDYYEKLAGWDRYFTDLWVFRQIDPSTVDASEYDPLSVMHYSFPAEFTTTRVGVVAAHELSKTDKAFIAKQYPKAKPSNTDTTFFERAIELRNDTNQTLEVKLAHQTQQDGKWIWAPALDPEASGLTLQLKPGQQRAMSGAPTGRRARYIAQSADGKKVWSAHRKQSIVTAPKAGYIEREPQVYVIAIDGPPDAPQLSADALYAAADDAAAEGNSTLARARFDEFVRRFPKHNWVPWARLGIVTSWIDDEHYRDALVESYGLISDFPDAEASGYAWFYGGVASLHLGKCADARAYFDYVADPKFGLPKDWRDAAGEYQGVSKSGSKYCD